MENQPKEGGGVDTINGKGSIVCKSCGHDLTYAQILFGKSAIEFHRSLHVRSAPTIICAAIWYDDKITTHKHQPKNIKSGYVVAGRRHHNCIATRSILRGASTVLISSSPPASSPTGAAVLTGDPLLPDERTETGTAPPAIQGFLTSDDRFVCREEAGEIAFEAMQIPIPTDCLMSEDLY